MGIFSIKSKRNAEEEVKDEAPKTLEERIIEAIRQVYDPEIPVNVYDMGLIYKVDIKEPEKDVRINMTLTTPNCPSAQWLPSEVHRRVAVVEDVNSVEVDIVWEPPWDPSMMSEDARFELGMF